MNREAKRRTLRKYSPPKRAQKESSIEILPHEGKVLIRFPEVVRTASFTPEQAMGLAQILVKTVQQVQSENE